MTTPYETRHKICEQVMPMLLHHGVKSLTMDMVAKQLGISKRTLYEIFENKESLVVATMRLMHSRHEARIRSRAEQADNAMEGMALALLVHKQIMAEMDLAFIRDMNDSYPHLESEFNHGMKRKQAMLLHAFEIGVSQGVFRPNADYRIIVRLFFIQLESLKRMEENFPTDVTFDQAMTTICSSLLRVIATPKGLEILDRVEFETY